MVNKKGRLLHCSLHEVLLSFAGHFDLFAGHLIKLNRSPSSDIFDFRRTCPACLANFVYTALAVPTSCLVLLHILHVGWHLRFYKGTGSVLCWIWWSNGECDAAFFWLLMWNGELGAFWLIPDQIVVEIDSTLRVLHYQHGSKRFHA